MHTLRHRRIVVVAVMVVTVLVQIYLNVYACTCMHAATSTYHISAHGSVPAHSRRRFTKLVQFSFFRVGPLTSLGPFAGLHLGLSLLLLVSLHCATGFFP